jgi:hypothetical protein
MRLSRIVTASLLAAAVLLAASVTAPAALGASAGIGRPAASDTSRVSCSAGDVWLELFGSAGERCYTGNGSLVVDLAGVDKERIIGTHQVCLSINGGVVRCVLGPGTIEFRPAALVLSISISTPGSVQAARGRPVVSPDWACYFPISGFYCYAQTLNGQAPLFNSNGSLYTKLPLNDKVKITCFYAGNPPSPWKGDGYMDHVTWENISRPIAGHIPDYYVNLGGNYPWQIGIPKC